MIGSTPVKAATFVTTNLVPGQDVAVVGLGPDFKMLSQSSEVANVAAASFPQSRTLRFRETNLDVATLVNGPGDFDGTIVDASGRVLGMWASFAYQTGRDLTQVNMGIQADVIVDMIEHLRSIRKLRSIEVEWQQMPLATARKVNLPESWVRSTRRTTRERREVLTVATMVASSPAAEFFRSGDILLDIDGQLANTFREVEEAAQKTVLDVTVFRNGEELKGKVDTVALDGLGIDRVVSWGGALYRRRTASSRCSAASARAASTSVLQFRLPCEPQRPIRRKAHRRARRRADAEPRGIHRRDQRARGPRVRAAQYDELERRARGHHDEARSGILAELRAAPRRLRVEAARPELICAGA